MTDISVFNSLSTLSEANEVLRARLAILGEKADLAGLKAIFDKYDISRRVGLSLLHKHYSIVEGERVVEFGHVSTPWPVPADGRVAGGYVVPRSWRFIDHKLEAYEFGFNHPGEESYDDDMPPNFVHDVETFLSENHLEDVLGICAIGTADLEGRIEKNRGRVNFTVPAQSPDEMDVNITPEHSPSVWTFAGDCKAEMKNSTIQLARACWVCPRH